MIHLSRERISEVIQGHPTNCAAFLQFSGQQLNWRRGRLNPTPSSFAEKASVSVAIPKTGNLSCRGALCLSPQRFFKQRITFLDEHAQHSGNSPAIEGSSEAGGTGGCDYDRAAAPLPVGWLLLRKLDRR